MNVKHQIKALIKLVLILLVLCSYAGQIDSAYALESTSSEGVDSLPSKIRDDLIISDDQEIVQKLNEIGGDLILSSWKINVTARLVTGNVNAIGSEVFIGGRIRESMRIIGYNISTDANIGRNLTVTSFPTRKIGFFNSKVELLKDCSVRTDADINAAEVIIDGEIAGNLRVAADKVVLGGIIQGDATILARKKLILQPNCRIEGKLEYRSTREAQIEEGAQVISGNIIFKRESFIGLLDIPWVWRIILGISSFLSGLLFILVCKKYVLDLMNILKHHFGQSLGIGFIGMLGLIMYFVLFLATAMLSIFYKPIFTLVPILAIAFIALILMFYFANILVAIFLGRTIVSIFNPRRECSPGRSLILGMVILIPVYSTPYIGIILFMVSSMIGFGAFAIQIFRGLKARRNAQ